MALMCSRQRLRNKKQRRPLESTGVVPAKDPPKVKLENFHHSRVLELGELCVPWFVRVLGFLQQHGVDILSFGKEDLSLQERSSLIRISYGILSLQDSLDQSLNMGHKIFPYMLMRGSQVRPCQLHQRFAYPLQLPSVNFISCPYILVILFTCLLSSRCNRQL